MKDKKRKTKEPSGSVKINPIILDKAREYCRGKGIKLYAYVSLALANQLSGDEE